MAYFEIPDSPEYNENVRKLETTDPGHADIFNAVTLALLENLAYLKGQIEQKGDDVGDTGLLAEYGETVVEAVNAIGEQMKTIETSVSTLIEQANIIQISDEDPGTENGKLIWIQGSTRMMYFRSTDTDSWQNVASVWS